MPSKVDEDFEKSWSSLVVKYALYQNDFKAKAKEFESRKLEFYKHMDELFNAPGSEEFGGRKDFVYALEDSGVSYSISVTRIQNTKVIFVPEKIEERIPKNLAKKIISKRYEISDFSGLVEYLKTCGVDPKKFKSYLNIEKSVNQEILDKFYDLGLIEKDQIDGCYSVHKNNPHYKVSIRRNEDEKSK